MDIFLVDSSRPWTNRPATVRRESCQPPLELPLRGLEREDISSRTPSRLQILPKTGGAESGADSAKTDLIEPDLAKVVNAWPGLHGPVKTAILAMIVTCTDPKGKPDRKDRG